MSARPEWLGALAAGVESIPAESLSRQEANPLGHPDDATRESGVLMLVSADASGAPQVLVTERSRSLRSHPGQLSFPGGSVEAGEDPRAAALRETAEEIGVAEDEIEVVGHLPRLYLPVSNFQITPVVGFWRDPRPLAPVSAEEVESIQIVPVADLADPARRVRVRAPRNPGWTMPGFLVGEDASLLLWGFTGGIVHTFFRFLGWIDDMPNAPIVDLPDYMLRGRERGLV